MVTHLGLVAEVDHALQQRQLGLLPGNLLGQQVAPLLRQFMHPNHIAAVD